MKVINLDAPDEYKTNCPKFLRKHIDHLYQMEEVSLNESYLPKFLNKTKC